MADGEVLNRTIIVHGFERDERDLLRLVQKFGRVIEMKLQRVSGSRSPAHLDVGRFVGETSKFERGSNRVPDPANPVSTDPEREATQSSPSFPMMEEIPKYMVKRAEDPLVTQKAVCCCESMLFTTLSDKQLDALAEKCSVISVLPEQELFVQGDEISFVYILVAGTVRIFAKFPIEARGCEGLYDDEIVVGSVSGTGQILGETDYLRGVKDLEHRHAISVSAEGHSVVVAVPVPALNELLGLTRHGGEKFHERLVVLAAENEERVEILSQSKWSEKSRLTQIMSEEDFRYLADVCGAKTLRAGVDVHDMPEYTESIIAIVLRGQIVLTAEDQTDPNLSKSASQTKPTSKKTILPMNIGQGEVLQECIKEAAAGLQKKDYFGAFKLTAAVEHRRDAIGRVVVEDGLSRMQPYGSGLHTEVLYVNYEDLRPVFSINFALRKYAEDNNISDTNDFPKSGNVMFLSRLSLLQENLNDPLPEPLARMPWSRNQERRLLHLAAAKRRRRDDWRTDLDDSDLAETAEEGTYKSIPFDPLKGANAPYFWNKTAIPTSTPDFRIHDNSLSEMEVSILFSSVPEASTAVRELDTLWSKRFARAKLAGQSTGYQRMICDFLEKLRSCGSDFRTAEQVEDDYKSQGVFADASIWREFVVIYNRSIPIQVEKAVGMMQQLLEEGVLDDELECLLCESVHLWCTMGYVHVAESIVETCQQTGLDVPRPVYTSILTGWIRLRELEQATNVMHTMQQLGIPPDIMTLNVLLALYVSMGYEEEACSLLDDIQQAAVEGAGDVPSKQSHVIVISGLVRHGDGRRVEAMVRRMLQRTGTPADALCVNLVVETWCIAYDIKQAQKVLVNMQSEWGCEADEETYALLAAGWAQAGKMNAASDVLLRLAGKGLDASKIDLNSILNDWRKQKWRKPKGFEVKLPSVVVQKLPPQSRHLLEKSAHLISPQPSRGDDSRIGTSLSSSFGADERLHKREKPPMKTSDRIDAMNKELWGKRTSDEEMFRNLALENRKGAAELP